VAGKRKEVARLRFRGERSQERALDAANAHVYGLSKACLRHVFETFHEGWGPGTTADHPTLGDYDKRLNLTMEHYGDWKRHRK
jgi:hypothetical protein